MIDLACTTGVSPGDKLDKILQNICGSVNSSSFIVDTSSTYSFEYRKIEWTVHNHYYIQNTPPLFENNIVKNERLLTKKEVADFLSISIKMIDRKVSMNEIPFLKIGKLVRFDKEKVLRWATENIPKGGTCVVSKTK
jgi:excisionase family DNA binding protein